MTMFMMRVVKPWRVGDAPSLGPSCFLPTCMLLPDGLHQSGFPTLEPSVWRSIFPREVASNEHMATETIIITTAKILVAHPTV